MAVGKNVEPHTNPRSHLFSSAPTKIAQAPLFEPFVYLLPPTRAAKILRAPIYYFNFNPRRDRMCHRHRLINAARGNLLLAKFLLLSCFYARARLCISRPFFRRAHRISARVSARLFIFRPRELLSFIFGQLKLLAFTQCFTILSYLGSKCFHASAMPVIF